MYLVLAVNLTAVSLERYFVICHPFRARQIWSRYFCLRLILASWVWAALAKDFPPAPPSPKAASLSVNLMEVAAVAPMSETLSRLRPYLNWSTVFTNEVDRCITKAQWHIPIVVSGLYATNLCSEPGESESQQYWLCGFSSTV